MGPVRRPGSSEKLEMLRAWMFFSFFKQTVANNISGEKMQKKKCQR